MATISSKRKVLDDNDFILFQCDNSSNLSSLRRNSGENTEGIDDNVPSVNQLLLMLNSKMDRFNSRLGKLEKAPASSVKVQESIIPLSEPKPNQSSSTTSVLP